MQSSDTTEGVISGSIGHGQGSDNASQLVFTSSDWNSVRTVTVTGVADNLSDGDQAYAIQLSGDNDTSDLRFANVDPAGCDGEKPRLHDQGRLLRFSDLLKGDTDENLKTATFTVSLSSAPSSDNVTITMKSSDTTEGVIISENLDHGRAATTSLRRVTTPRQLVFNRGFSELELGEDGDGDGCGGQSLRRGPGLRDSTERRQLAFGPALCECGS